MNDGLDHRWHTSLRLTRRMSMLGLLAACATPRSVVASGLRAGTLASIDTVMNAALQSRQIVGAALRVQHRGAALLNKGYGLADLETGRVATPETVFRIGSVSKQFTATAALLLAEEGRLSLESRLSEFLPDFPRAGSITIRQMMNHTSGIRSYSSGIDPNRDYTIAQFVDVIRGQEALFEFEPGTRWSYSNSGYYLLGAIIERASGRAFADFLATRILTPQRLADTAVDARPEMVPHRAAGYMPVEGGGFRKAPPLSWTVPGPAGGLRSTVGDLSRWHAALFGGHVVNREHLRDMTTPARLNDGRLASASTLGPVTAIEPGQDYGLGLALSSVAGRLRVDHYGRILGYTAYLATFPALDLSIALLTNTEAVPADVPQRIEAALLADPVFAVS